MRHSETPQIKKILFAIFLRQLKLLWCNKISLLHGLSFFIISVLIFKVTANIHNIEAHLIVLLFSIMLSSDTIIIKDYHNKILEQLVLLDIKIEMLLMTKLIAHIIFIGIPFMAIIILFHFLTNGNFPEFSIFLMVMLTICNIMLINVFASTLCLISTQNLLAPLLAMPFLLPTMIFAALSVNEQYYINMLVATSMIESPILIIASSAIIRATIKFNP